MVTCSGFDAGSQTVTVTSAATDNYNAASKTYTLTINKASSSFTATVYTSMKTADGDTQTDYRLKPNVAGTFTFVNEGNQSHCLSFDRALCKTPTSCYSDANANTCIVHAMSYYGNVKIMVIFTPSNSSYGTSSKSLSVYHALTVGRTY